jgi:hypothetical protein
MDDKLYQYCPICGYPLFEGDPTKAIGSMALHVSYDICTCCGCEYGLDDTPEYRTEWIEGGCQWFDPEKKPFAWNPSEQLKNSDPDWNMGWQDYVHKPTE